MLLQIPCLECSSVAHMANDIGKLVSALITAPLFPARCYP